jgi:hypothetical protein
MKVKEKLMTKPAPQKRILIVDLKMKTFLVNLEIQGSEEVEEEVIKPI